MEGRHSLVLPTLCNDQPDVPRQFQPAADKDQIVCVEGGRILVAGLRRQWLE
jgi:hypothetical protein